jgi:oxygen-independent coproporphyrinogen-3 oxidase
MAVLPVQVPYCDFNSHVASGSITARWRSALLRELEHYARDTRPPRHQHLFRRRHAVADGPETVAPLIARCA